ncbi:MAG TPA: nitroreductase family protein [Symbiobacteriaceae bacterium]|nr:nitroreductase family protein [Symbiobacteriaceae bacterium]
MATLAVWEPGGESDRRAERWNQAIARRHSVRTYDGTPLSPDDASALAGLRPLQLGTARIRHVLIQGDEALARIMRGLVGGYGKLVGAPALVAFVAQTQDPGHTAGLGYLGQQVVLEAVSRGLSTCWVAGAFRRDAVREYADLAEGEDVLCISPIGRAAETAGLRRFHDASMKWLTPGHGKRKPLAEIVRGEVTEPWLARALEAARWAPSAVNRQPWLFTVLDGGRVSLTCSGAAESKQALDCGIAMANFAIAAQSQGAAGVWKLHVPDKL